jgi:SAM-dependent methyltransferase
MTGMANAAQSEAWNGDSGRRWVARADERDRVLAPVAELLVAASPPLPGVDVLDVGCGCGATTLMVASHIGSRGSVTGFDLSAPMLDLARQRATEAGATTASFVQGDAQTHRFEPESVDLVISRFGTMFFSDPIAAFSNIATALRAGGRVRLATWQPLAANEWLTVPGAALLRHTELPETPSDDPGMFAQADPEIVTGTLTAAGFENVRLEPHELSLTLGPTIEAAVDHLADSGPGRVLLETIPEGPPRDAAIAEVGKVLVDHYDGAGVRLGAGVWLITATR